MFGAAAPVIASAAKQSSLAVIEGRPTCSGGVDCFAALAMTGGAKRIAAYAALASLAFSTAKAQSSHCVSAVTSLASTVAPHQMRRPGGASR